MLVCVVVFMVMSVSLLLSIRCRWAEAMSNQGSGGAYEISQRMTAMVSRYIIMTDLHINIVQPCINI